MTCSTFKFGPLMSTKTRWAVLFLVLAFLTVLIRSCQSTPSPSDDHDSSGLTAGSARKEKAKLPPTKDSLTSDKEDATEAKGGTLFAIVKVAAKGAKLEHRVAKPSLSYRDSRVGRARFQVKDPVSGRVLATGRCPWPRLCKCPLKSDHRIGCVPTRHEAVIRLKLPLLSRGVLVRIETLNGGIWTEAGCFKIEE